MRDLLRLKLYLLRFLLISGAGYMRNFVANLIKRSIGMETFYNPSDIFFRDYIRHFLGFQPLPKITSRGCPDEGIGSQARLTMCAINFARVLGLDYVHTPFREQHGGGRFAFRLSHADQPMEAWVKSWEAEFNLGAGEICAKNDVEVLDFAQIFYRYRYLDTVFNVTAKEFQRKYYLTKEKRVNPLLTIGVHVRRGDVLPGTRFWTEHTSITTTIVSLKDILDKRNISYRIQVFSEGNHPEFREFEALGGELFLDTDALWTMRELIEADILVMAKSLFTYVAALISDGIKLYEPWPKTTGVHPPHPPLKNWLVRLPTGEFDERRFAIALEAMTQSNRS